MLSDGHVRCWGNSSGSSYYYYYNYGFGTGGYDSISQHPIEVAIVTTASKVAVGFAHSCALTTTGDVYCWGYNSAGEVQPGGSNGYSVLTPVLAGSGYAMIVAGNSFTCGQKKDETDQILSWGSDSYGNFGDGVAYVAPPSAATRNNVSKLAAGANHVCALKAGKVSCWGYNANGQTTGLDYYVNEPLEVANLPLASDLATGTNHTCAVASGKVYCWGYGYDGQLGLGSTSSFSSPQEVLGIFHGGQRVRGGEPHLRRAGQQEHSLLGAGQLRPTWSGRRPITLHADRLGERRREPERPQSGRQSQLCPQRLWRSLVLGHRQLLHVPDHFR